MTSVGSVSSTLSAPSTALLPTVHLTQLPKCVMVFGEIGSGKSTVAKRLVESYGYTEIAIAAPLKGMLEHLFGFSKDQLYDPKQKEEVDPFWGFSPRQAMQEVGTELMRHAFSLTGLARRGAIGENVFVWRMMQILKSQPGPFVVSDVRFLNEYRALIQHGAVAVRVDRPDSKCKSGVSTHASEKDWHHFAADDRLVNDSSLEAFEAAIDHALQHKWSHVDVSLTRERMAML